MINYARLQYSTRNKRLRSVGVRDYQEYLRSEHWKQVKKIAKERGFLDNGCWCCGAKVKLVLHHLSYTRIHAKPSLANLQAVCNNCHNLIHVLVNADPTRWALGGTARSMKRMFKEKKILGYTKTGTPIFGKKA